MGAREFRDGAQDGLEALEPLDPEQIGSFDGLLTAMRKTAFGGRRLGEAYEVLWAMIEDPDCFVVLTLSGAMTIAKMGKIISAMIDLGVDLRALEQEPELRRIFRRVVSESLSHREAIHFPARWLPNTELRALHRHRHPRHHRWRNLTQRALRT